MPSLGAPGICAEHPLADLLDSTVDTRRTMAWMDATGLACTQHGREGQGLKSLKVYVTRDRQRHESSLGHPLWHLLFSLFSPLNT